MTNLVSDEVQVSFSQGWTADVAAAGHYVYLDWHLTGAQAPALTDLAPFEARAFAIALLQAAEVAEDGKG